MHDPLAVATAVMPELIDWERAGVEVGSEGEERGATRLTDQDSLEVARAVETGRFLENFLDVLGIVREQA